MILSGKEIYKQYNNHNIGISDFNCKRLNPNSYNLRLHNKLLVYDSLTLDMKKDNKTKEITIPDSGFELSSERLYLGRTQEYTQTYGYVPMLEGRSSIARLGVNIHVTAGFGDIGFCGYWTLEISCIEPVIIYPFIEICQIYYHTVEGEYETYGEKKNAKYQNNNDIQSSKIYKEFV